MFLKKSAYLIALLYSDLLFARFSGRTHSKKSIFTNELMELNFE